MDDAKKIEQLRYVLNRFDHYLEGANSKGNFLLAFSGFLFGFIASNFNEIVALNDESFNKLTTCLLIIILILGLVSIGFTIVAVSPFLKNNNSSRKKYHSLIFFNSIAQMEEKEFIKNYEGQREKDISRDMAKQIHAISKGLQSKYFKIEWSLKLLIIQLILILCIILTKSL